MKRTPNPIRPPAASSLRKTARAVLIFALTALAADSASAGLFGRSRQDAAAAAANARFPAKGDPSTAESRALNHDGVQRTYLIQTVSGRSNAPVVVLLHGGTETAAKIWVQSSLPTLAAQQGFILVAPQGLNNHWNDGRGSVLGGKGSQADDVGFLRAVITQVVAQEHADPKAVFMVGPSNGGFMTMYFACQSADLLRAGANVISNLPVSMQKDCKPSKPLPWMSMNGTADPFFPFNGQANPVEKNGEQQPPLLSADQTFSFWADRAACSRDVRSERIQGPTGGNDDFADKRTRGGCNGGASSVQYVLYGAGHTFPGMLIKSLLITRIIGRSSQAVDAGTVIWDFFRSTLTPGT